MSNLDNNSELMQLIDDDDTNEALALIATGKSNLGHQNVKGRTALHLACVNNNTTIALALIATGKSNPGCQTKYGNTALHLACYERNIVLIKALLATGESNPECRNNRYEIARNIADMYGYSDIADILSAY